MNTELWHHRNPGLAPGDSSGLQLLDGLLLLMYKLLQCCHPVLSSVHPAPPFACLPA